MTRIANHKPFGGNYPYSTTVTVAASDADEFHEWVRDNLAGYETSLWFREALDKEGNRVYRVIAGFVDDVPAVHFKMRWF